MFRIFNRWQAVNQQWKVLNYDKMKDTDEHQKYGASLRTLAFPGPRGGAPPNGVPGTAEGSPSSLFSLMAATVTPTATAVPVDGAAGPEMQDSSEPGNHCAYNILQRLSQLRKPEPQPQPQPRDPGNRELVMRVTTV